MTDSETKDLESKGNGAVPEEAEAGAEAAAAAGPPPDPLEEAKAEMARIRDQLLRTAADFDNYRKRSRRELADAEQRSREDVLRELLPVFDNLERAVQHAESATDVQALADGIRMVMRQFADTLGKIGIVRTEAIGKPFDPALHEAIQHLESAEFAAGTVMAEAQPGYRVGDRLLRPALVVVSKGPKVPENEPPAAE